MRPIRTLATALLVASLAAAGCGTSQPDPPTTPPSQPPVVTAPPTPAPPTPTPPAPGPTARPRTERSATTPAAGGWASARLGIPCHVPHRDPEGGGHGSTHLATTAAA